MPTSSIVDQWKALNPQERKSAMSRMSSEQKMKLASALGYKGESESPSSTESTDPSGRTPTGKPAPGDKRNAAQRWLDNLITPDPRREEWQSPAKNTADDVARHAAQNFIPILSHPLNTMGGMVKSAGQALANNPGNAQGVVSDLFIKPIVEQVVSESQEKGPTRAALNLLGTGAGMWATGEVTGAGTKPLNERVIGPITRGIASKAAKAREGMVRGITGTGKRAVNPIIEETQAANEAARNAHMKEAQGAVEKQKIRKEAAIEKGRADASKFQAEKERVAEENRRNVKAQRDRSVLAEKRTNAYRDMQAEVETTRANALKEGNKKYSGVNDALSNIESDPKFLSDAVSNATESLRGSKTEPTLLKSMESTIKQGGVPTYSDLQGDYSTLGREISKGNLSGDVFHAYDQLHEAIGNEMQRIANSTEIDAMQPVTKSMDPVRKGYVRLYRAESPTTKFADVFNAEKLNEHGFSAPAQGERSFTADPDYADYYKQSYGRDAKTYYIDVPEQTAKAALRGNGDYLLNPDLFKTNLGPQLSAARNYWRRMKQAFGKPFNPSDVATNTMERTAPDVASAEEYANRLRLMSNPEWGGQGIMKAQATLDTLNRADAALPKEAPITDVVKPNPARPESLDISGKPIVPSDTARTIARDVTDRPVDRTIGTKEITEANKEALRKFDNRVKQRGFWIASGAAGYKLLSDVLHGRLAAVPGDIAEGALALGAVQAVARLLENPEVVEMLSRPTDAQIRSIPPELRGDLRPVVEQAQRQGIKVDQRLAALVGAGTAAVVGPKTQNLQRMADEQRNGANTQ